MTLGQLKEKLNQIHPANDHLEVLATDPNDSSLYSLTGSWRLGHCSEDGYECDEDVKGAQQVIIL